jgi:spore coat protein A, manganese oxidase
MKSATQRLVTLWAITLVAGHAAGIARAQQITLTAIKDNTLFQDSAGALSAGADDNFFVGRTDQGAGVDLRRGLVLFDLSAIPAGSTITGATFTLYMNRTQAGDRPVSLHRALADWGEAGSAGGGQGGTGGAALPGDATWLHRFYPSTFWATPGGDYIATASASRLVGGNGTYSWTSPGLLADVQAWVNGQAPNYGWLIRGDESASKTAKRFSSREASNTSRRPQLVVVYTPPADVGACCLPGGVCQVTTQSLCTSQSGTYQGNGTGCSPNPCAPTGACCLGDGTCQVLTQSECAAQAGTYQGNSTACSPNPCPQPTGACCFAAGVCNVTEEALCIATGGTYQGNGTTCSPNPCPMVLEPFVDPLPRPGAAAPITGVPGGAATYHIAMTEFSQKLHRDLPATRVWGYGSTAPGSAGSFPGPTVEARAGIPITVKWINDLRDANGMLRTEHYLPVDHCLHGPHQWGSLPRTVVHLHGGHVPMESDGYPEATFLPGQDTTYEYPNNQQASTAWYHDHAVGITRLNVYMGLAGFYLIRDDVEDALGLPAGEYEIPLAIQDRTFRPDGSLVYPEMWHEHFYGDTLLVNGVVWPYLEVKQGKYRLRILNGSNSRVYRLSLSNGGTFHIIGTDGGLLPAPVPMTEITLTPGERLDTIFDFAGYPPGTQIVLTNSAPAPYPGQVGVGVIPQVMLFVVGNQPGHTAAIPSALRPVVPIPENTAAESRQFILRKHPEPCAGSHWLINGLRWDDITEYPRLDTNEIWAFINRSGEVHPMHMHLVHFQVLDRQAFEVINEEIVPVGPKMPPPLHERGWKDTVAAYPMEITRVIARFENYMGKYAYHCHVLEHEDHEMMRQFQTTCYANCDASTTPPVLNVEDFSCFINMFATGNPYANCDQSTTPPILNVEDFSCFINRFAQGCE